MEGGKKGEGRLCFLREPLGKVSRLLPRHSGCLSNNCARTTWRPPATLHRNVCSSDVDFLRWVTHWTVACFLLLFSGWEAKRKKRRRTMFDLAFLDHQNVIERHSSKEILLPKCPHQSPRGCRATPDTPVWQHTNLGVWGMQILRTCESVCINNKRKRLRSNWKGTLFQWESRQTTCCAVLISFVFLLCFATRNCAAF